LFKSPDSPFSPFDGSYLNPSVLAEVKGWKGSWSEREDKYEEHNEGQEFTTTVERRFHVKRFRMAHSEDDEEDDKSQPSGVIEYSENGHEENDCPKDPAALPAKKGIYDMTTVQLSDGDKIEGRDEKADPARISGRMKDHVVTGRNPAEHEPLEDLKQERITELYEAHPFGDPLYGGKFNPENNEWHRHEESAQGTGNADIEKGILIDDDTFHLDDGAEGSERREGERDEIGERSRNAITSAREVVPHLMGQKNGHDGTAVYGPSNEIC
jgi:hypothetical protein